MKDKEVDIDEIDRKIDMLVETAGKLPDKEGTKLFEDKIFPLIKIQRSFLRKHGGIPENGCIW